MHEFFLSGGGILPPPETPGGWHCHGFFLTPGVAEGADGRRRCQGALPKIMSAPAIEAGSRPRRLRNSRGIENKTVPVVLRGGLGVAELRPQQAKNGVARPRGTRIFAENRLTRADGGTKMALKWCGTTIYIKHSAADIKDGNRGTTPGLPTGD